MADFTVSRRQCALAYIGQCVQCVVADGRHLTAADNRSPAPGPTMCIERFGQIGPGFKNCRTRRLLGEPLQAPGSTLVRGVRVVRFIGRECTLVRADQAIEPQREAVVTDSRNSPQQCRQLRVETECQQQHGCRPDQDVQNFDQGVHRITLSRGSLPTAPRPGSPPLLSWLNAPHSPPP